LIEEIADGFCSAKKPPIVKMEPFQNNDLFDFRTAVACITHWRSLMKMYPGRGGGVSVPGPGGYLALSFEVFDFEHHLWGDGAFLIEHGISESLLGDSADFSWYAEAELMNGLQGLLIEDRLFGSCQVHVMSHVMPGLFRAERGHVVADGDSLVKRFHDGKLHDSTQIGLTGEDEDEGVIGVHLEVGKKPEFFQGTSLEQMGFIDNEKDGFAGSFFGLQESALDLGVDGAFGKPWSQAEKTIDVIEEICAAEGGKGCIKGFEEILIEAVHVATQSEGFAHPRVSCEQQDAPSSFDVLQAGGAFF
jgi:hypothetical protein